MSRPQPIIADRAEFVAVLNLMRRGHVLLQNGDRPDCCVISGARVYHSVPTLLAYGLLDPMPQRDLAPQIRCFRLSRRGRQFADRAWTAWQRKPLLQRMAVRLLG